MLSGPHANRIWEAWYIIQVGSHCLKQNMTGCSPESWIRLLPNSWTVEPTWSWATALAVCMEPSRDKSRIDIDRRSPSNHDGHEKATAPPGFSASIHSLIGQATFSRCMATARQPIISGLEWDVTYLRGLIIANWALDRHLGSNLSHHNRQQHAPFSPITRLISLLLAASFTATHPVTATTLPSWPRTT